MKQEEQEEEIKIEDTRVLSKKSSFSNNNELLNEMISPMATMRKMNGIDIGAIPSLSYDGRLRF